MSDVRSFLPEPADDEAELLEGVEERDSSSATPICRSRRIRWPVIELVNPGSVGMPFDHDQRAAYALVHADGERRAPARRLRPRPRARRRSRERFPGFGETVARRIEAARFDV